MKAADVMVSNVVTVGPRACVQDVAALLLHKRISAVPVVSDDGNLIGIVSESDLMRRPEGGTERSHSSWLELITSKETLAQDFVKSHSRNVTDVMTANVVTASPEASVGEIAALLERNQIKRVPIVKDGKIVGIVSRANLLQALASLKKEKVSARTESDTLLRDRLIRQLEEQPWSRPSLLNVTVQDGVAELWGVVDTEAEKKAFRVLAEVTPGIRAVNDNASVQRFVMAF